MFQRQATLRGMASPGLARLGLSALVAIAIAASNTWAQTVPNAGTLQQQIEREQQGTVPRLQAQPQSKTAPEPALVGQTVVVRAFKFKGNTLLSDAQLSEALAHLLERPLDFARLQSSAVVVADLYRDKGWVVQTYLPEQDVALGEVTIAIVEAVFGKGRIAGNAPRRIAPQTVLDIVARQQQSGQFINMNVLDRALLLADDLPGVAVTGTLAQGQQSGQTDLLLQVADEPWHTGSVTADNTGAVSTGSERVLAALRLNSPAGLGDALSVNGMSTAGSSYGRLAYSLPLGSDGWRVGVNASRLDYKLISDAFTSLNANGYATTAGLELSYPLVRGRMFNLSTSLSAEEKKYFNASGGATSSAYTNTPATLGLSGNSFDALGGGGANAFSVGVTAGKLNLSGSPTEASDASTTRSAGEFTSMHYNASRQQQLSPTVSLYAAFSGQWADRNLDSSEKFYLGGSSGVRAYPSSEAGGSIGQLLNVELRWQLPEGVNLTAFYDHGSVTPNVSNSFAGAPALNAWNLQGAGVAVNWNLTSGVTLQATYARRIGDNPNPITTVVNQGADQDGTLRLDRLWLTASAAF
jgi:hemolysin activation/secretion protein